MFRTPNTVAAVAAGLLLAGCGAGAVDANDVATTDEAGNLSATDAAAVVALVNYPGTTEDVLDHAVGLDTRAARATRP